ncbi:unnamed protein product [Vicia faba]|uniref:Uncharacterized protein n=1 Tax=Vicia faba TaxID=3906 RepID=A0AAV0ZUC8_VICFA|nr:unnamed protein product [Vicia faba]
MERRIITQALVDSERDGDSAKEENKENLNLMVNLIEVMEDTLKVIEIDFPNNSGTPSKITKKIEITTPVRVSTPKSWDNKDNLDEGPKVETKGKPWVVVIQGNRDLNRGMSVEFVATKVVNGEVEVTIEELDVEDELHYWEPALILFALGKALSMNAVKKFMEKVLH